MDVSREHNIVRLAANHTERVDEERSGKTRQSTDSSLRGMYAAVGCKLGEHIEKLGPLRIAEAIERRVGRLKALRPAAIRQHDFTAGEHDMHKSALFRFYVANVVAVDQVPRGNQDIMRLATRPAALSGDDDSLMRADHHVAFRQSGAEAAFFKKHR